jgi:hypothetical protein
LQRVLIPFYAHHGMRWQSYGRLIHGWLIENRAPHTDWSQGGKPAKPRPVIDFS